MKNFRWLLTFLIFLSAGHVVGSPHLSRRQGESLTDGLPGWLWDVTGLGTAVEVTHWFLNEFVPPNGWSPTPSDRPDSDSTSRKDPQDNLGSDIELDTIVAPVTNLGDECKPLAWSGDQASIVSLIFWTSLGLGHHLANIQSVCQPGMSFDPCNVATAQIVYPIDCRTSGMSADVIIGQYRAIEVALSGLVGTSGYETIPRSCGIFFYTTSLTPAQMKTLQELELPPEIGPDKMVDLLDDRTASPVVVQHQSPQREVERRKVATDLISQTDANPDLVFISQYPVLVKSSWPVSVPAYHYYNDFDVSKQKQPVLVYVIDSGAVQNSNEFLREYSSNGQMVKENVIKGWIYASDTGTINEDDWSSQPGGNIALGHGTCVTQKICGLKKGVHKNAHVIVVQLMRNGPLHSFLIALENIANDLVMRKGRGEDIGGHVVINISLGFKQIGTVNEKQMLPLLERLWNGFQAIVVAATGNDAQDTDTEIDRHPAAFAKRFKSPIITVGGVDARGYLAPRSRRGRGLTVTAPYLVTCTDEALPPPSSSLASADSLQEADVTMSGTSFATAIVSGVISAWLSDDELGAKLRAGDDISKVPRRVKELVMNLSYKRSGATVASIWNGVNVYQPTRWPPNVPKVF